MILPGAGRSLSHSIGAHRRSSAGKILRWGGVLAVVLLAGTTAARAELTCDQLGAIGLRAVELRDQGWALSRLLADAERMIEQPGTTPADVEQAKVVIDATYKRALLPHEVYNECVARRSRR
jgi:hypothetical protein